MVDAVADVVAPEFDLTKDADEVGVVDCGLIGVGCWVCVEAEDQVNREIISVVMSVVVMTSAVE